ncbi:MAG: Crp/Fnr family transcriptional regulator, partial [Phycisphaerae bacterium]
MSQLPDVWMMLPHATDMPESVRDAIRQQAEPWSAAAGSTIFDVGDPCPGLVLLVSGEIRISRRRGRGRGVLLYRVRPGEICPMSAISVLGQHPCLVSASAEGDARGVLLPAELLRTVLADCPAFRDSLFQGAAMRMAHAVELIEDLAFGTVEQRVARWLHSRSAPILVTHSEIAEDVGTAREVVSRVLKELEHQKIVSLRRGEVWVSQPNALRRAIG